MIDDRTRRLMRAQTRLAVAAQILELAAIDAGAVREDLGDAIERSRQAIEHAARECEQELDDPEPAGRALR